MIRTASTLAAVLALGLGLAACETATPYQPAAHGAAVYGGFTDQQIDSNHVRVTFQGNGATARTTVENYLLYRAAELTVKNGFDWFETVDNKTKDHPESFVVGGGYGVGYGYWRPSWRFHGRGGWRLGFGFGDPFWGDPWDDDFDVQTIDRYEADAQVVMGHGPKPDDHAFDARDVMAHLGPTIVRPS